MNILAGQTVLITGGTGSFGHAFIARMLKQNPGPRRICILSRDELKQSEQRQTFHDDHRLRFFLGDVRDVDRLRLAFSGVDTVIHAAAMKQVPACAYNPTEAVATNVTGSENVIQAALSCGVARCLLLSTDKATNSTTLYGSTKHVAERLFVAANSYSRDGRPMFSATRYGNVAGSRGSVIPLFKWKAAAGHVLPVTDPDMTRFWMTLDEAVDLVILALTCMRGGEVFIPKLPAYTIGDLARAIGGPLGKTDTIGARVGEKQHESLLGPDEARSAHDYGDHYRIQPTYHPWRDDLAEEAPLVTPGTEVRSDNTRRLSVEELRALLGIANTEVA